MSLKTVDDILSHYRRGGDEKEGKHDTEGQNALSGGGKGETTGQKMGENLPE
ncbi:hypothetical protein [Paenibacillus macerans]|uniref:hypothetical protein n=1 Tax=Paenibacillus macerans TaxID=44252 RepID=UPI00203FA65E|nr:hypothetical protein [Paenibacillus macerans]MCM3703774.1 hypothetical protein [Paenibacillus macerans]